jgi:hypothetical protein
MPTTATSRSKSRRKERPMASPVAWIRAVPFSLAVEVILLVEGDWIPRARIEAANVLGVGRHDSHQRETAARAWCTLAHVVTRSAVVAEIRRFSTHRRDQLMRMRTGGTAHTLTLWRSPPCISRDVACPQPRGGGRTVSRRDQLARFPLGCVGFLRLVAHKVEFARSSSDGRRSVRPTITALPIVRASWPCRRERRPSADELRKRRYCLTPSRRARSGRCRRTAEGSRAPPASGVAAPLPPSEAIDQRISCARLAFAATIPAK